MVCCVQPSMGGRGCFRRRRYSARLCMASGDRGRSARIVTWHLFRAYCWKSAGESEGLRTMRRGVRWWSAQVVSGFCWGRPSARRPGCSLAGFARQATSAVTSIHLHANVTGRTGVRTATRPLILQLFHVLQVPSSNIEITFCHEYPSTIRVHRPKLSSVLQTSNFIDQRSGIVGSACFQNSSRWLSQNPTQYLTVVR